MPNHETWCNLLKKYWEEKDINKIISLFSEDVIYYETPTEKLNSIKDVKTAWSEIKNQTTIDITYKILCTENNKCIVNFILTDNPTYDMIYEIVLDDNNKCTYFKQWFMEV